MCDTYWLFTLFSKTLKERLNVPRDIIIGYQVGESLCIQLICHTTSEPNQCETKAFQHWAGVSVKLSCSFQWSSPLISGKSEVKVLEILVYKVFHWIYVFTKYKFPRNACHVAEGSIAPSEIWQTPRIVLLVVYSEIKTFVGLLVLLFCFKYGLSLCTATV